MINNAIAVCAGEDEVLAGEAAYRLGLAYIKMSDAKIALTVCIFPP